MQTISTNRLYSGYAKQNQDIPPFLFIREQREKKGIRCAYIAKVLGYKNITKGSRKILSWEETAFPNAQIQQQYLDCIGISLEEVQQAYEAYTQSLPYLYTEHPCNHALIAQYHQLLLTHIATIKTNPQWYHCTMEHIFFGLAFMGCHEIRLGPLLEAWHDGLFQNPEKYALCGTGSPLSGSHTLQIFSKTPPHTIEQSRYFFSPLMKNIKPLGFGDKHPISLWSLPQIIAQLGGKVEKCTIQKQGTTIGCYDYHNQTLDITLEKSTMHLCCELPPPYAKSEVALDSTYQDWQICAQNIQYRDKTIVHWDYDLPPIVAQLLVMELHKNNVLK